MIKKKVGGLGGLAGREGEELDESVEDIDPRLLYSRHSVGRRHLSDVIARHEVLGGRDRTRNLRKEDRAQSSPSAVPPASMPTRLEKADRRVRHDSPSVRATSDRTNVRVF
jgi:hypothetical protein